MTFSISYFPNLHFQIGDVAREDSPQIYALCGRGASSKLKVLIWICFFDLQLTHCNHGLLLLLKQLFLYARVCVFVILILLRVGGVVRVGNFGREENYVFCRLCHHVIMP